MNRYDKYKLLSDPLNRHLHLAGCVGEDVVMFGGLTRDNQNHYSFSGIHVYGSREKTWKFMFSEGPQTPKVRIGACAVNINWSIYIFGGKETLPSIKHRNDVWKLNPIVKRAPNGEITYRFKWQHMGVLNEENTPLPRSRHSGWEYNRSMWIFGGVVDTHVPRPSLQLTNEVCCFTPKTQTAGEWNTITCTGYVPSCRMSHATVRARDYAWLYGGEIQGYKKLNDLYHLHMRTLQWTMVILFAGAERPPRMSCHTLNQLGHDKILLYGDVFGNDAAWALDIETMLWKTTQRNTLYNRVNHTGTTVGNSVVILGGSLLNLIITVDSDDIQAD